MSKLEQRFRAMTQAVERGAAFRARVAEAGDDAVRCADLMAEAIDMHREQRSLAPVGKDGRVMVTIETLEAMSCLDAARAAYGRARRANVPPRAMDVSSGNDAG